MQRDTPKRVYSSDVFCTLTAPSAVVQKTIQLTNNKLGVLVGIPKVEKIGISNPLVTTKFQITRRFLTLLARGEFRPRQTRQLPRAVDLKGRLLSSQSY